MNINCSRPVGIALLCCGHALNDFYNNFLPVLLPLLIIKYDLSLTLSGVLVMVLSITSNLMQPAFGYIFDKYNLSKILVFAIPAGGIIMCSVGYLPNQAALILLLVLLGLTVSSFHPLGPSLLRQVADKGSQARAMAYFVAGGNLGFAMAPILVVAFLENHQMEDLPWMAIPAIILGALFWWSGIHRLPTSAKSLAKSNAIQISGNDERLRDNLKNPSIIKLNLAMGLRCWTNVAVGTFLPLLLIDNGYSPVMAGGMLTVFLVGAAFGGLLGGELGDRFHHKWVIVSSLLLSIFPTYYFFNNASTDIISLIALFTAGFFVQAGQPSSIVWAQRLMPKYVGVASGMMLGASYGMGSIGAALTAVLAEEIGLGLALLLSIVPCVVAALLVFATPFAEKGKM